MYAFFIKIKCFLLVVYIDYQSINNSYRFIFILLKIKILTSFLPHG